MPLSSPKLMAVKKISGRWSDR